MVPELALRGDTKMIVVLGYYGFANLGDEAILQTLCHDLLDLGFSHQNILVVSGNPEQTRADHGVKAIGRFDFVQLWQALGSARCLIAGGGSLLQDVTSKRSIPYYLGIVELALLRKVPVLMYGQGVGPVQSKCYGRWVRRAFTKSVAYTVRDQVSAQLLDDLGVPDRLGSLCADPVFQKTPQSNSVSIGAPRVLLNLRPYSLWPKQQELWVGLIQYWQEQGQLVEFMPLGPGDRDLGLALQTRLPKLQVHPTLTLDRVKEVYEGATLCISMRLHGIIFAALEGVLPLGLNYDPKVEAISEQLHIPYWELEDLASLRTAVETVIAQREYYELQYTPALEELRTRAVGNRAMLAQVLKQG